MHNGKLPDNYITKEQAAAMGWEAKRGICLRSQTVKPLAEIFTKTETKNYRMLMAESGMKQI
jgi:hypothetical protein